jgi:hypothetical protein
MMNMKALRKTLLTLFVLSLCTTAGAIDIKLKKDKATVDGVTYAINAKKQTAQVVKGQEPYVGDIVIPEKVVVDSVTLYVEEIASGAFKACPGLTSVTIPECITKIGSSAFEGCSSLTEVTLPSRIKELPSDLFKSCASLTRVNMSDAVNKMGSDIFQDCKSLTDFEIPSSMTEIPVSMFEGCRCVLANYEQEGWRIDAIDENGSVDGSIKLCRTGIDFKTMSKTSRKRASMKGDVPRVIASDFKEAGDHGTVHRCHRDLRQNDERA